MWSGRSEEKDEEEGEEKEEEERRGGGGDWFGDGISLISFIHSKFHQHSASDLGRPVDNTSIRALKALRNAVDPRSDGGEPPQRTMERFQIASSGVTPT